MIDFEKNYSLKNDIVELIPLDPMHLEKLYVQSDHSDIWKYFTEDGYGRDNFENYILRAINNRREKKEYPFTIKDLRTNEIAGMTRIYNVNNEFKSLKIGHTWIGKTFQGTLLNKNTKYILFEFLFDKLGVERIGFGASAKNIKSINALESVGCQKEGVLRSFLPAKNANTRIDVALLSILKNDWTDFVKTELGQKINI